MNATVYILGIFLQAVAGIIALWQVRRAPRRLPWLLIAASSLLIVVRRGAVLQQSMKVGSALAFAEVLTLVITVLFFLGVVFMSRMFREIAAGQEARQRSEALLRDAGHIARFGGWSVDLKDNRVFWSDEVASIHEKEPGFSPSVDEGMQFYSPEWRTRIAEVFSACVRNGTPYDEEMEVITARGRRIWVRTSGEAVRDPSGRIVRVQGSFQNITERKTMEAQLLQAQKMEAIGQLAGGVAHDFRNQLQVIQGFGEMLLRRSLVKEEGRKMVEEILNAGKRSATTAGRLLAYGRREMLRPIVQSVTECITEIGKLLPQMIGEDIHLVIQSSTEEDKIRVDPHLLQQAVFNLATNARDAMPTGGAIIIETACVTFDEIQSHQIDPELAAGQYVVVSVNDTGCGMDKAALARAFEPYFTTKDVSKGSGLGLAMVYGFVKQSGGAIAIQSQPGRGTAVQLYFPRIAPPPVNTPAGHAPPATRAGSETVLIVEDEAAVLSVTAELVRDTGYRVLAAASAEKALALMAGHDGSLDLLVTDIVMPGMSGVSLAEQLRSRYPGLSVLYISGYPGVELASRGVDSSMECLAKPFSGQLLLGRIRQVLDTRKTASGL